MNKRGGITASPEACGNRSAFYKPVAAVGAVLATAGLITGCGTAQEQLPRSVCADITNTASDPDLLRQRALDCRQALETGKVAIIAYDTVSSVLAEEQADRAEQIFNETFGSSLDFEAFEASDSARRIFNDRNILCVSKDSKVANGARIADKEMPLTDYVGVIGLTSKGPCGEYSGYAEIDSGRYGMYLDVDGDVAAGIAHEYAHFFLHMAHASSLALTDEEARKIQHVTLSDFSDVVQGEECNLMGGSNYIPGADTGKAALGALPLNYPNSVQQRAVLWPYRVLDNAPDPRRELIPGEELIVDAKQSEEYVALPLRTPIKHLLRDANNFYEMTYEELTFSPHRSCNGKTGLDLHLVQNGYLATSIVKDLRVPDGSIESKFTIDDRTIAVEGLGNNSYKLTIESGE